MNGDVNCQTLSTQARHHLALRSAGLRPICTNTGYVWPEGNIRRATHEPRRMGVWNVIRLGVLSASNLCPFTAKPLTTSSTSTLRVVPIRAFSGCQPLASPLEYSAAPAIKTHRRFDQNVLVPALGPQAPQRSLCQVTSMRRRCRQCGGRSQNRENACEPSPQLTRPRNL